MIFINILKPIYLIIRMNIFDSQFPIRFSHHGASMKTLLQFSSQICRETNFRHYFAIFGGTFFLTFFGTIFEKSALFQIELFCYKSQQMIVLNKKQIAHCLFEHTWATVDETLQRTEKSLNVNGCTRCKSEN